ncbi:hypothetical protein TcCL_Unassigned03638 [Trypanosoma cruzi]|nr:hypothetical protein TcCL_Unassigned03638 [Trypanosoma cruzi]
MRKKTRARLPGSGSGDSDSGVPPPIKLSGSVDCGARGTADTPQSSSSVTGLCFAPSAAAPSPGAGALLYFIIIHFLPRGNGRPYEWAPKRPSHVLFAQLVGVEVARRVSCGGPPDAILPAPRGRRAKETLSTFFSSVMNDRGSGETRRTRRGPRNASVAAMATA